MHKSKEVGCGEKYIRGKAVQKGLSLAKDFSFILLILKVLALGKSQIRFAFYKNLCVVGLCMVELEGGYWKWRFPACKVYCFIQA